MTIEPIDSVGLIKDYAKKTEFWLLAILAALVVLHLNLLWQLTGNGDALIIRVVFWGAIAYLIWNRRDRLNWQSDPVSTGIGGILIYWLMWMSISAHNQDPLFLWAYPPVAFLSLGLIASGIKGLWQYWREFMITLMIVIPEEWYTSTLMFATEKALNVNVVTGKIAAFAFWYAGMDVQSQGAVIVLPNGGVQVETHCTGLVFVFLLLRLCILLSLLFPGFWVRKSTLFLGTGILAYLLGAVRVMLLALVVHNQPVFDYWHGDSGSQIFSTISILIFGIMCKFILLDRIFDDHESNPSEEFDLYFEDYDYEDPEASEAEFQMVAESSEADPIASINQNQTKVDPDQSANLQKS
ncbi:Exosortase EpsH-related protein [Thalassoporum mexicanum PCC 7367]|uniref:cyanoexosortase A n=1 Tax=Thalassoporum mexicanum TaxID=3457544 RepID=UPI00029FCD7E|nr:cyanoexosortase A [Pseudanabaena sp. PCC 7367]AFY69433.1 Exosortase EpsH-related protein [Pseudanabaena sp. PCC 7367]